MTTMKEFLDEVHEGGGIEAVGTVVDAEFDPDSKPRSGVLPGMEEVFPTIPAVTAAAREYASARDLRMAQLKLEVEAKNKLLMLMHLHKLESYRDNSEDPAVFIELKTTEKIKVKIGDDDGEDED